MKCEVGVAQESRHMSQSGLVTYTVCDPPVPFLKKKNGDGMLALRQNGSEEHCERTQ